MEDKPAKRGRQPRAVKESVAAIPIKQEPDQLLVKDPAKVKGGKRTADVSETVAAEKPPKKTTGKKTKAQAAEQTNEMQENAPIAAIGKDVVPVKKSRSTKKNVVVDQPNGVVLDENKAKDISSSESNGLMEKEKNGPVRKGRSTKKKDTVEELPVRAITPVKQQKSKGKKTVAKDGQKENKDSKTEPVEADKEDESPVPTKRGRSKAIPTKVAEPDESVSPPKPKGRGKAKEIINGETAAKTKEDVKSTVETAKATKPNARGKKKVAAVEDITPDVASAPEPPAKPVELPKRGTTRKAIVMSEADGEAETAGTSKTKRKAASPAINGDIPTVTQRKRTKAPVNDGEEETTVPSKEKKAKVAAPKMNKCATDYGTISFELEEAKPWNLKISSWNVAGLRSWIGKGGLEFLDHEQPDILCVQETKCAEDQLPDEARHIKGYHPYWLCKPGGYAGVAIYSKKMPIHVVYGLGDEEQDQDGRLLTAEYEKFYLVCVYVPNAGKKLVTLPKRMRWDEKFHQYLRDLDAKKPVILCGDMNVAHEEIDLANPKTNRKNAGFTQEERDGMSNLLSLGFVDTFRKLYPDQTGAYTFWTYMGGARAKNVGWRLDYFITSERLVDKVTDNVIRTQVYGSDHCPELEPFVFCPRCNKIYPGWDWQKVLAEHADTPQHGGAQGENYPGVYIDLDFLSTAEEADLLQGLDELPWDISQSGRRKQNFGPKTNFKKARLRLAQFAGFPRVTEFVQRRFEAIPLLGSFQTIEQCSLEYAPERGASIDPHIDDCWIWGERIVTVNMLSDSVLTMSPYRCADGKLKYNLRFLEQYRDHLLGELMDEKTMLRYENRVVRIPMPRRSLLVLYGSPRYQWEHSVLREDITERRVCLAYREFTPMYLQGGSEYSQSEDIFERAKQFWDHRSVKVDS
uniref:exodeoxyribonuclease III n=1 Tax=Anopheles minimus TaxID=112268 RepID=A0A182WHJ8_9DIPT